MSKTTTKDILISTGLKLMLTKGYGGMGLQEIVKDAGVPKGSFYHFFPSKEAFGLAVLEAHVAEFEAFIKRFLLDTKTSPLERLRNFFHAGRQQMAAAQCEGGCLVGNLVQELADQDATFRQRLEEIMAGWERHIESCLVQAQQERTLDESVAASELARFILDSWEGAILRMKVTKDIAPVDGFIHILFEKVLKHP